MLVRLTEVCNNVAITANGEITLREIFVNPEHVIMIREDHKYKRLLEEGRLPTGLDTHHRFSRITINKGHTGSDVTVIGGPEMIETALNKQRQQQLLRG